MIFLFAFLIGSIPSGFIIGLLHGTDVRKQGSGNIGATNVGRILGRNAGILTLILDVLKGIIAIKLLANFSDANPSFVGLAAILGHCFSPFLKFQGGKGVATSLGVFLYLSTGVGLIILATFLITLLFSNYISLGSIIAAVVLPISVYLTNYNLELFQMSLVISALVIYKHKANIHRLLKGEENKFRKKK